MLFEDVGVGFQEEPTLGLDVTLRAHAASHLHQWVSLVLDAANPTIAATLAAKLRREGYPIYITRDLDAAREYVRRRFAGETQRRYGLLASSRAKNLDSYGIDPGFQATRRVRIDRWFNDGLESPEGGCHLDTVITQFQCQGLELDLPIVCWGAVRTQCAESGCGLSGDAAKSFSPARRGQFAAPTMRRAASGSIPARQQLAALSILAKVRSLLPRLRKSHT